MAGECNAKGALKRYTRLSEPDRTCRKARGAPLASFVQYRISASFIAFGGKYFQSTCCYGRYSVDQPEISLIPHGLSAVIQPLRLTFTAPPNSRISSLIHSCPLLEDLVAAAHYNASTDGSDSPDGLSAATRPSSFDKSQCTYPTAT